MSTRNQINMRLDEAMLDRWKARAKAHGVTLTDLIIQAMAEEPVDAVASVRVPPPTPKRQTVATLRQHPKVAPTVPGNVAWCGLKGYKPTN